MRKTSPFLLVALLLFGCDSKEEASTDAKHSPSEAEISLQIDPASAAVEHSVAYGSVSTAALETAAAESRSVDGRRYGLLVGCTKYYHLPDADLSGPSNDVRLMQSLLTEQFDFAAEDITMLIEEQPKENRPTKKNIVREFKALAAKAAPGDQAVILLSGHGTQQPDDDPDNKDDLEPDGMDEVFCPADTKVSPFIAATEVPNGITDDELRKFITDIREAGASVWVVVDSCHSGTSVRGNRVYRQISPQTLLPNMAPVAVRRSATRSTATSGGYDVGDQGGLVAIYASHSYEPTFELALPGGSEDAEPHGILTYTLAHVLMAADGNMTYAELVNRIQNEYIMHGVAAPTPLVEGADRHREVLGQKAWPDRSRLTLQVHLATGMPKIDAGRLHGISKGCIFAVHPPAGEADQDTAVGYVKVINAKKSYSIVEPCAFGEAEKAEKLPLGGRLEIVHYDYGDMQLAVAVDLPQDNKEFDAKPWNERLKSLAAEDGSLIRVADSVDAADWLIRPIADGKLVLVPSQGWPETPEQTKGFGPVPADDEADQWLADRLTRIARAQNLLKVSGVTESQKEKGLFSFLTGNRDKGLSVEFVRLDDEDDAEGKPLTAEKSGLELTVNDLVAVKLHNEVREAVDVSLLFVDSSFGITPLFPAAETVVDNRLLPGKSLVVGPMQVEGDSLGLEHLVIIAVKAETTPIDFAWLAQDAIETTRSTTESAGPLDELLKTALFAQGTTRGMRMKSSSDATLKVISWRTVE